MTRIYHVTNKRRAEEILQSGIRYHPRDENWVMKRKQLREIIDSIGRENHENWINRVGSVFFWSTLDDAKTYTRVVNGVPVIIVIDSTGLDLWCVDNHEIEFLFDNYMNDRLDDTEEKVQDVVKYARRWNGDQRKRLELWTKPPVSCDNIIEVLNRNGEKSNDIQS